MRILGVIFYAAIITFIGVAMIVFALDKLPAQSVFDTLAYTQSNASSKMIVGLSGILLILISFSFAQLILGKFAREKTIAFTTASGEVTIALSAVEDLIRRQTGLLPEIKELRPDVIATKKGGIMVDLRVVLRSEANIPELTGRLQEITRSRIQEVLGVEEQIVIKIHVVKIISAEEKGRRKDPDREEPAIPFGGYGRV